ncbi:MAG: ATP-binding cassette domain-containing protein [Dehalococcoidia bacterium]|nr:ATP-binding cassette domain-containing protein [Dehalococcoidia bacterium]
MTRLDETPRIETHNATASAVELVGLSFAYPDGMPALRGIDLRVEPGEKVALLGPNGAGKSTLLLHLNGVFRGQGEVRIFAERLTEANLRLIRAKVGLLFSNPDDQLFSPTVLDDVAYGPLHMGLPREEVLERTRVALEQVGMQGFEDRVPHRLSLGQKKRVAIATVLSMGTPILALDEPSASLSPVARRELIDLLQSLPQTMLISTHDLALARDLLPRTVVLDEGRVVADGATADILEDADLLVAHGLEPLSAHRHQHEGAG